MPKDVLKNITRVIWSRYKRISLLLGCTFLILSLLLGYLNKETYSGQWVTFFLWLIGSLSIICFAVFHEYVLEYKSTKNVNSIGNIKNHANTCFHGLKKIIAKDWAIILLLMLVAIVLRFIFMDIYPFHTVSDQLRDGGRQTKEVINGDFENIFGYGSYNSHGLIIPIANIPFYMVFGDSFYAFRVPSAIISLAGIFVLYILVRRFINKPSAIFATLTLICMPIDLYYARTEPVVIWSTLLTVTLLLSLCLLLAKPTSLSRVILLGITIGITFNFYASVRPVAFLALGFGVLALLYFYIRRALSNKKKFKQNAVGYLLSISLLGVFVLLGFGPRVFHTPMDIFLHQSRAINVTDEEEPSLLQKAYEGVETYPESLMVYIAEDTTIDNYQREEPILSIWLSIFFIVGLAISLVFPNKYLITFITFIFILPYTNSSLTDIVNISRRLTPLTVLASIFVGYGVYLLSYKSKLFHYFFPRKLADIFVIFFFLIFISFQAFNFFYMEDANKSMFRQVKINEYQDFMLMYAVKDIQIREEYEDKTLCFNYKSRDNEYFNYHHVREHYWYYLKDNIVLRNIVYNNSKDTYLNDNYLIVTKDRCLKNVDEFLNESENYDVIEPCNSPKKFVCPVPHQPFSIYIER